MFLLTPFVVIHYIATLKAVRLFTLSAEQGFVGAQSNLGLMLFGCEGVPADYPAAVRWYKKAADQGHPSSLKDLPLALNRLFPAGTVLGFEPWILPC
jgi:TPR repeat protein